MVVSKGAQNRSCLSAFPPPHASLDQPWCICQICCYSLVYYLSPGDRFHAGGSCMAHTAKVALCWDLAAWIPGSTAHKTDRQNPADRNRIPPMERWGWPKRRRWKRRSGSPSQAGMCLGRKREKIQPGCFVRNQMFTKVSLWSDNCCLGGLLKWSGHLIFSGSRGFGVGLSTLLSSGLLTLITVLSLPPCLITGSALCLQSDTHTTTYSPSHTPINDTLNAHLHIDLHVSSRAPTHTQTLITGGIFDLANE